MDNAYEHFLYCQRSGRFALVNNQGVVSYLGRGYSGVGAGYNNPERENVKGQGPIPAGLWRVQSPIHHPQLGPLAFRLSHSDEDGRDVPAPHGRSAFLIHGDNRRRNGTASIGCIVLDRFVRTTIASLHKKGVHRLVVVPHIGVKG